MKLGKTLSRTMRPMTVETLDGVPLPCRGCNFWEVAGAPRGHAGRDGPATKRDWVSSTTAGWGPPGRVVYLDDRPVAFGMLAPGSGVGGLQHVSHRPSGDAVLLTTMWVDPQFRGEGLGRALLQTLLRDAHERRGRAVEAYGARGPMRVGSCVLSEKFLLATGFSVVHEHPTLPLLRLDLRMTVRWQESVSGALEPVIDALSRRRVAPAPARFSWTPG